jgi:hypothetical protein
LDLIDPSKKYRVLFETVWERGLWDSDVWGETVINDKLWLDCCFVDFINNDWILGQKINAAYFNELIKLIEEAIKKI